MPGESVAAYINNTITFIIFILVCIILFVLMYLISAGIRKKVLRRNRQISYIETDERSRDKSFIEMQHGSRKNPFKRKNTTLLGISFALTLLSVILILASLYFPLNIGLNINIVLIFFVLFSIATIVVYIFRSGIIKK